MAVSKQNEIFVYQGVLNGDLEIMPDGTIWRIRKRTWDRRSKKAISSPCERVRAERPGGKKGSYLQVGLMIDGKRVFCLAHRLVWHHFKGPIPAGLTINHRDGVRKTNAPDNLELATLSQQQLHSVHVLGTARVANQDGPQNKMVKLTTRQVRTIRRRRATGERLASIAKDFPVTMQTISKIARGEARKKA